MTDEIRNELMKQLMQNRTILINKAIDDSIIEDAVMNIIGWNMDDSIEEKESKSYDRKTNPIHIYINSIGGQADSMFSLINAIETSKTPVFTYTLGKAYSAGFMIFITGHVRFAQRYSSFMYHQTAYGRHGEHQYHEEMMEYDKLIQDVAEKHVLRYTKIPKKKLEEIRKSKVDWFMIADDAARTKLKIFDFWF